MVTRMVMTDKTTSSCMPICGVGWENDELLGTEDLAVKRQCAVVIDQVRA